MQLSVIIINYNVKYFLEHCLLSVIKACKGIEAEIFVADNNSTDGSEAYLSPKFTEVKFRWNRSNPGFAKANNSILPETTGKYVLFLNPDTIVPEDCFVKCISFFEEHTDCGGLGVRMIDGSGKFLRESKRSLPSVSGSFFKMTGLARLFPSSKIFAKYYADYLPENKTDAVDVLAGAFMMLSKKAINDTAGFDEDFFMYGEDVDLSIRIIKSGLKNYYFAGTTIIHFKGESTQKKSLLYVQHFYNAMKLFIDKHYKGMPVRKKLMKAAVSFSKKIADMKNKISAADKFPEANKNKNTILAGNEMNTGVIKELLKNACSNYPVSAVTESTEAAKINKIIKQENAEAIIFCEGILSAKNIIELLQQMPADCEALFHMSRGQSIIGSNDKNTAGMFIAKN